jgi:hypothetical protein
MILIKPTEFLPFVPKLYDLFVTSPNNWVRIKLLKLFQILCTIEPRLPKKLSSHLLNLLQSSKSTSLVFEIVSIVIHGSILSHSYSENLMKATIENVLVFIRQSDINLKYLGLELIAIQLNRNESLTKEYNADILRCLEDKDIEIRSKSIELLEHIVSPEYLLPTVQTLLLQLSDCDYSKLTELERNYYFKLGKTIIALFKHNCYSNITDFEWYIEVLLELSKYTYLKIGHLIKEQLIQVCFYKESIRPYMISTLLEVFSNWVSLDSEVISAIGWIIGEFGDQYAQEFFQVCLGSKKMECACAETQPILLFALMKLCLKDCQLNITDDYIMLEIEPLLKSIQFNVQDRAILLYEVLMESKKKKSDLNPWDTDVFGESKTIFSTNIVSANEQTRQPLPVPLQLDLCTSLENVDNAIIYKSIYERKIENEDPSQFYLSSSPEKTSFERLKVSNLPDENSNTSDLKKLKRKKNKKGKSKYLAWQDEKYTVEVQWSDMPIDSTKLLNLRLECSVFVSSTKNKTPQIFELIEPHSQNHCFHINFERKSIKELFYGLFTLKLMIDNKEIILEIEFPSEFNLTRSIHQRPGEVVERLQKLSLNSIGTTMIIPPPGIETAKACNLIMRHVSANIIDSHPGIYSFCGSTLNGCEFFGLIKEKRIQNGLFCLMIDIKTNEEATLSLVMNSIANLASNWLKREASPNLSSSVIVL